MIKDCRRFILCFFDVIQESACHIYHSALPWSPTSSLIRKLYGNHLSTEVRVLAGVYPLWDACIRTISTREVPPFTPKVAFSHRGDTIAIAEPGSARIFEASTGGRKALLEAPMLKAKCIAFSADDTLVVFLYTDRVVKFWDVQTGNLVKTFELEVDSLITSAAYWSRGN